jgi:hypothetical protein
VFRKFLCLGQPGRVLAGMPGLTEYVGVAGIGGDVTQPRVPGTFWRDQGAVVPHTFQDGTSSTVIVLETAADNGPWAAGGLATVRVLDPNRQPYVGWGRPFGGVYSANTEMLMADGSTLRCSPQVNPKALEFRVTPAGGENTSGDW